MSKLIAFLLAVSLACLSGCIEETQEPEYFPDVPPGVNVMYYDFSDGIAPDTVYFLALVGDWNGVDTLFYRLSEKLAEGERVIEEYWYLDYNVELAVAYDPLDALELLWRAWMAGDTAELSWTP
jgi:hypothetical protein